MRLDTVTDCDEKELVLSVVQYEIGGRGTEWLLWLIMLKRNWYWLWYSMRLMEGELSGYCDWLCWKGTGADSDTVWDWWKRNWVDTVTECAEKELVVTVVYMRYMRLVEGELSGYCDWLCWTDCGTVWDWWKRNWVDTVTDCAEKELVLIMV